MRLATANTYDMTLANLTNRQAGLADLQEKLSAGKKVLRPSDDPTGAAQAERAMNRLTRIETDQRALNIQRNAVAVAESTLGDTVHAIQTIRDLVLSAGNGAYNKENRASIAQQIRSLRDQLVTFANKQDSNGVPIFGGLGSSSAPFTESASGVVSYNGISGQQSSTTVAIPSTLDGQSIWMSVPTGNGIFKVSLGSANTGTAYTDIGQAINPSLVTGHNYTVTFTVTAGVTSYEVIDTDIVVVPPALPVPVASGTYTPGQAIEFDGLSIQVQGTPADGDTLGVAPSQYTNIFDVIDQAIASIDDAPNSNRLTQEIALALAQLDAGTDRIQAARGLAGELLNRADTIETNQNTKSDQIEADRSRAEDMDMIKGISQFQNQQTGYDAALQTYAQIQRLSLFNYLG